MEALLRIKQVVCLLNEVQISGLGDLKVLSHPIERHLAASKCKHRVYILFFFGLISWSIVHFHVAKVVQHVAIVRVIAFMIVKDCSVHFFF